MAYLETPSIYSLRQATRLYDRAWYSLETESVRQDGSEVPRT